MVPIDSRHDQTVNICVVRFIAIASSTKGKIDLNDKGKTIIRNTAITKITTAVGVELE